MAHVGRTWKLWFRRDFGVNLQTSRGPAEAYLVRTQEYFVPMDPGGQFFDFMAINTNKDPGDTRQWLFRPIARFGLQWAGSLTITSDPNDPVDKVIIDIVNDFAGLVFSIEWTAAESNDYQWETMGWSHARILFIKPGYSFSPFVNASSMGALGWDKYPP